MLKQRIRVHDPIRAIGSWVERSSGSVMAANKLDEYIDTVAMALALPVEEGWRPAVKANLEVSLKMARVVDEFTLPDETEPASVYSA
jgi:hypothetical protein